MQGTNLSVDAQVVYGNTVVVRLSSLGAEPEIRLLVQVIYLGSTLENSSRTEGSRIGQEEKTKRWLQNLLSLVSQTEYLKKSTRCFLEARGLALLPPGLALLPPDQSSCGCRPPKGGGETS